MSLQKSYKYYNRWLVLKGETFLKSYLLWNGNGRQLYERSLKKTCRFRRYQKLKSLRFNKNISTKKLIFFCCCCMCKLFCSFFAYSFSVGRIHKRPGNAVFSTAISYYSKWSKERAVASQTKSNQPLVFISFTLAKQSCVYRVLQKVSHSYR